MMKTDSLTPFQLRLLLVVKTLGSEAWGHHIGLRAFRTKHVEDRSNYYLQGLGMNANKRCNQLVKSGYLNCVPDTKDSSRMYYTLTPKGESILQDYKSEN